MGCRSSQPQGSKAVITRPLPKDDDVFSPPRTPLIAVPIAVLSPYTATPAQRPPSPAASKQRVPPPAFQRPVSPPASATKVDLLVRQMYDQGTTSQAPKAPPAAPEAPRSVHVPPSLPLVAQTTYVEESGFHDLAVGNPPPVERDNSDNRDTKIAPTVSMEHGVVDMNDDDSTDSFHNAPESDVGSP